MSTSGSRETRRVFGGTGVYIALFLVVTALAVAGYWTLIPHSTAPAGQTRPTLPETVEKTEVLPQKPPQPEGPARQPAAEAEPALPAAPAQSAVPIVLPEAEPDLAPAAPSPVVYPLVGETIAAFSMDELAYSETLGDWRTHDGIDIAAEPGTPVCAACAGTVLDVRADDLMGTTVVISHDGGRDTIYSNLQSEPTVAVGDYVTAGQVIGSVGRTALSESSGPPHLHFGVTQDGEYIDPADYLASR